MIALLIPKFNSPISPLMKKYFTIRLQINMLFYCHYFADCESDLYCTYRNQVAVNNRETDKILKECSFAYVLNRNYRLPRIRGTKRI